MAGHVSKEGRRENRFRLHPQQQGQREREIDFIAADISSRFENMDKN